MTAVAEAGRRPAELVPAAALVLAVILTLVPYTAGSELRSAEPARTVATLHTAVGR